MLLYDTPILEIFSIQIKYVQKNCQLLMLYKQKQTSKAQFQLQFPENNNHIFAEHSRREKGLIRGCLMLPFHP